MALERIGKNQPAQVAAKSKKTKQTPQNYIIDFTDLPKKYRTAEMRKKFDKNGNGFLESKNSTNNMDEIQIMENAIGLDLSKYKKGIIGSVYSMVDSETDIDYNPISVSTAKLSDGSTIELIGSGYENGEKIHGNKISKEAFDDFYIRAVTNKDKTIATVHDENGDASSYQEWYVRSYADVTKEITEKNTTYKSQKGFTKVTTYYNDGNITENYKRGEIYSRDGIYSKDYRDIWIDKDTNGDIIKLVDRGVKTVDDNGCGELELLDGYNIEKTVLFGGKGSKNTLLRIDKEIYTPDSQKAANPDNEYETESEDDNRNILTRYLLNGEEVQVSKSTDGRYYIVTKDGTKTYSHNGILLREDYANADKIKYPDGRTLKISPNGETKWYFINGKQVNKNEFYKKQPFEVHRDKNGNVSYTLKGEPVDAKPIENGRYQVTLNNGETRIYSHDGKELSDTYLKNKEKENKSIFNKICRIFR